jgi:uncharacterized membrane protein
MTFVDKLVPQYVRFLWGYGYVSLAMAMTSFGMSLVTMLTVKGIYISLWTLLLIGGGVVIFCTSIGYCFEKKNIQNRITSHVNKNANPEFKKVCRDIVLIKKKLEIPDE